MSETFPEYHKIHSLYMRDDKGRIVPGQYARPEIGYLAALDWEWTEKVDGTNIRIGIDTDGAYRIGGRTDDAQIPAHLLDAIAALDLEPKLRAAFDGPVTLYGEGYGAKIQKGGGNYRPDRGFVLFDVRVGPWWLHRDDVVDVAAKLGIDVVPIVRTGPISIAEPFVARGFPSRWGAFNAEGLVGRPAVPLFGRDGSRVIVKIKTVDYARLARDGVDLDALFAGAL